MQVPLVLHGYRSLPSSSLLSKCILYHTEGPTIPLPIRKHDCSQIPGFYTSQRRSQDIRSVLDNLCSPPWGKFYLRVRKHEEDEDCAYRQADIQTRRLEIRQRTDWDANQNVIVLCPPTRPSSFNQEIEDETTREKSDNLWKLDNSPRDVIHSCCRRNTTKS